MKSSTFSLIAIALIPLAWLLAAYLDNGAQQPFADQKQLDLAREMCGNASYQFQRDGDQIVITCLRRKPLNGSKVRP